MKKPGRKRRMYAIARVRLISFHNFVDETIELRDGGHLFLLGDNGSGKTTVLDAIQYVLSGGLGIELNAAARVGGRRNEGRSLAGIVLRYDAERGVVNEGGAVAYAALELRARGDDGELGEERLCLGVGFEATTMEASVRRWGFITSGTLEELPLLEELPEGRAALGRDAMRERLAKHESFGHIGDYRRAVAEKLFGGFSEYEEVCAFWAMAKAYREIVAKSRDFAALFQRLLPGPNLEVLSEILESFRALDDLQDKVDAIARQLVYVNDVETLLHELEARREEIARYAWLASDWKREENQRAIEVSAKALADLEMAIAHAEAAVQACEAARLRAERALRDAEADDSEGLGARLRAAGEANAERQARLGKQAALLLEATQECANAEEEGASAEAESGGLRARRLAEVEHALARCDAALPFARAVVLEATATADENVKAELRDEGAKRERKQREAADLLAIARRSQEEARAEVERIESDLEPVPRLAEFASARAALAAEGIEAVPLYTKLEPRRGASEYRLAALEALMGEESLVALVTPAEDRARARTAVEAVATDVRVLARVADLRWPEWVAELVHTDPETARAVAAAIADPVAGEAAPPDATGSVEHRGLGFRPAHARPRWIGGAAREGERNRRLNLARAGRTEADAEAARAEDGLSRATGALDAFSALREAVDALDDREVQAAERRLEGVRLRLSHLRERRMREERLHAEYAAEQEETRAALAVLQARADALGLREIERRIAELRLSAEEQQRKSRGAMEELGGLRTRRGATEEKLERLRKRSGQLEVEGEELASRLRARLGDDLAAERTDMGALREYVYVRQRGRQFQSAAAIDERLRAAERMESAVAAELEGDGHRGLRNLHYAARFGLSYDAARGRVTDRRAEPIANVRADLELTLEEQRSVVNERTRALMDKLVMRTLVQELQGQLERLRVTVRDINRLLEGLRFGRTRYRFKVSPSKERAELVSLVQGVNLLDEESQVRFKAFVLDQLDELKGNEVREGQIPELLDYRLWHSYGLSMRTLGDQDIELDQTLRRVGSGGEQGVPNYLLVLALGSLVFESAQARVRPLLFDEAFYGIDAGRRDELLRFGTALGLQLVVASPDQDGATEAAQRATTLFLVKDPHGDVHLAPYHFWLRDQGSLFAAGPEDEDAVARIGE